MKRFSLVLLLVAATAAVTVTAANAVVVGKPNPGPPPQAQFNAAWNGTSSCVFSEVATCTNTASAWWSNAPTVRWVEFDFSCNDEYSYSCGPFNPANILISSHVNGSSGGSANTPFNFTQLGCGAAYSFEASFFDARGHFLGYADSGYTAVGYC